MLGWLLGVKAWQDLVILAYNKTPELSENRSLGYHGNTFSLTVLPKQWEVKVQVVTVLKRHEGV
jgi:hypothetical protein